MLKKLQSVHYLTASRPTAVFELFDVEWYHDMTLKSGLEVTQDHSKLYNSKACVRFPIRLP